MSTDNWPAKLAAPLPTDSISWRQDGKPTQRDGKFVARFVAYTDAQVVRERLDAVVPGEWHLTLELLPAQALADDNGEVLCAFKATLAVFNVTREDVGQGKDYKSASTDAFKRAAVRFGIGHELYSMGQVWVTVDGDGKYAKPLEDPSAVYARKQGKGNGNVTQPQQHPRAESGGVERNKSTGSAAPDPDPIQATTRTQEALANVPKPEPVTVEVAVWPPPTLDEPSCPKCGGKTWDNRLSKRNPKAPDFKCRNRSCDGVIWPPKPNGASTNRTGRDDTSGPYEAPLDEPPPYDTDGVPF